jgi:hypothetical protein
MMAERTALITAKRETEDELVRTIIKLSSASLLLLPSLLFLQKDNIIIYLNIWLIIGAISFTACLLCAMLEQFLSSKAYDRQIRISMSYYRRLSTITSDEIFSACVRWTQTIAFGLFAFGIIASAIGVYKHGTGVIMSNKPSPPPPPPPPPAPSYPGYKDGGRSVPPAAPPPPRQNVRAVIPAQAGIHVSHDMR